jgi:hypothetical protein
VCVCVILCRANFSGGAVSYVEYHGIVTRPQGGGAGPVGMGAAGGPGMMASAPAAGVGGMMGAGPMMGGPPGSQYVGVGAAATGPPKY